MKFTSLTLRCFLASLRMSRMKLSFVPPMVGKKTLTIARDRLKMRVIPWSVMYLYRSSFERNLERSSSAGCISTFFGPSIWLNLSRFYPYKLLSMFNKRFSITYHFNTYVQKQLYYMISTWGRCSDQNHKLPSIYRGCQQSEKEDKQ